MDRQLVGGETPGKTVTSVTRAATKSQAERLVELAEDAEFFLSPTGTPHATVVTGEGTHETWRIQSQAFRSWLMGRFHETEKRVPRAQAMADAVNALAGRAVLERKVWEVHVRVAAVPNAIYLDLGDRARQVIEIGLNGWELKSEVPVRFRRPKGMLPLPIPQKGGDLEDLDGLLNLSGHDMAAAKVLVRAWLLSTLQPTGALPILVVGGEQGSAKSTGARILKEVIDPCAGPLRSEPRQIDDLMIAATNSLVIALDNVSNIRPWLSDALCRLATGAGLSKRELYSDADEVIMEARRSVILTGIEELATRPDLLDRAVILNLAPVPDRKRRTEKEVLQEFRTAHPRILGGLLDAVSVALRKREDTRLPAIPRMADFTLWAAAAAPELGTTAEMFVLTYSQNRKSANAAALECSPIAPAILRLLDAGDFEGTAQDLLDRLAHQEPMDTTNQRAWPKSARALRGSLERLAPSLRVAGVSVTFLPRTSNSRPIRIQREAEADSEFDRDASTSVNEFDVGNDDSDGGFSAPRTDGVQPLEARVSPGVSVRARAVDEGSCFS